MIARVTEGELKAAIDRLITLDQRRHLVAEIRRLRRLLVKLANPDRYLGPQCPRHEGRCCWCNARIEGVARESHDPGCPWPELKLEALATIQEGGPHRLPALSPPVQKEAESTSESGSRKAQR